MAAPATCRSRGAKMRSKGEEYELAKEVHVCTELEHKSHWASESGIRGHSGQLTSPNMSSSPSCRPFIPSVSSGRGCSGDRPLAQSGVGWPASCCCPCSMGPAAAAAAAMQPARLAAASPSVRSAMSPAAGASSVAAGAMAGAATAAGAAAGAMAVGAAVAGTASTAAMPAAAPMAPAASAFLPLRLNMRLKRPDFFSLPTAAWG